MISAACFDLQATTLLPLKVAFHHPFGTMRRAATSRQGVDERANNRANESVDWEDEDKARQSKRDCAGVLSC